MSKTTEAAKVPSDEMLHQLSDLFCVPSEQREFFFDSIRTAVRKACDLEGLGKQSLASKRGKKLVEAALALYDTLGNLTHRERAVIEGIFKQTTSIFDRISDDGLAGLDETAHQFALLATLLTGKPSPRYPSQFPEAPGRGRRWGSIKDPIFQELVFDLLIAIRAADGTFTFTKETPSGTFVEALDRLAEYLPVNFLPKRPPGSTIQRLIDRSNRLRAAVDEFE
jgi:hypothetical protein